MLINKFCKNRIGLIIDEQAPLFYHTDKNRELFKIKREGWKYIDMIPGDPGQNGHMRKQKMEFGSFLYGRCRVFVCFANDDWRICNIYGLGESVQARTNQVIEIITGTL